MLDHFFQRLWYSGRVHWFSVVLLPLSGLFGLITAVRRSAYRAGVFKAVRVSRPVLVVGNITVGGVGKTPLTIWLASLLEARGVQAGVVLRGYGGRSASWPRDVAADSSPAEVGDEAVLLANRTSAIVAAGPDRVATARRVIERGAQIVLSDDGLQHYRLARDGEIVVIDEKRGLGNGRLLPAGPLREPQRRLETVDLVVLTRRTAETARSADAEFPASMIAVARLSGVISLTTGEIRTVESFKGRRVHAIAAIGHPQAFFESLSARGLSFDAHAFADHAPLSPANLQFGDDAPVLMTEKDAVKCRAFADGRLWSVRMDVEIDAQDAMVISKLLDRMLAGRRTIN
ncbi:MAG: tetraacyldisaccharide 4'-kinase [Steroidobacter sp.]